MISDRLVLFEQTRIFWYDRTLNYDVINADGSALSNSSNTKQNNVLITKQFYNT